VARNPELLREQMRQTDRAMGNIEAHPEGFNALARMYQDVQEPMMNAMSSQRNEGSGGGSGTGGADNPFGALFGAAPPVANTGSPNTTPMPNPWAPAAPAPAGAGAGGGAAGAGVNPFASMFGGGGAGAGAGAGAGGNPFAGMGGGGGGNPFAGMGGMGGGGGMVGLYKLNPVVTRKLEIAWFQPLSSL
jgi:ubiquilin